MEDVLVTGATGLIGRAAVKKISESGYRVRALVRSKKDAEKSFSPLNESVTLLEYDLARMNDSDASAAMDGVGTVIHSGGLVHKPSASPDLYQQINDIPTAILAHAALRAKASQFIFLSSSSVYGNRETNMVDEFEPCLADTPYAASKMNCERLLKESPPCPSTVILRPSMVFGEGDRGNMLSLIRQVLSGKYFLVANGVAQKSLIYADDFVDGLLILMNERRAGCATYNLANPQAVSMKVLSEEILSAAGKEPKLLSFPQGLIKSLSGVANAVLGNRSPLSAERLDKLTRSNTICVQRFVDDFSFQPKTSLRQALEHEINWARSSGQLK